jgi:GNAT superfamily N-acetyltransferase
MDTPVIRPATEQDIEELVALYIEFHEFHVLGVPDRLRKPDTYDNALLRERLRELAQRDDAQIFVASSEEKLVGLAEVYLRQDEPHPLTIAHRYGYLQSLIISARFRKSGLGKKLVSAAHEWARKQNATEMQIHCWEFPEGPLPFYEALGYRTLKRHLVIDLS